MRKRGRAEIEEWEVKVCKLRQDVGSQVPSSHEDSRGKWSVHALCQIWYVIWGMGYEEEVDSRVSHAAKASRSKCTGAGG
jgi:hypothetical protein